MLFELRPESLEQEGLVAALMKQEAVLRTRYHLKVEFVLEEEPALPLNSKHALYRIAQEALHNVVKHAQASTVTLHVARQAQDIVLEVRDNGCGFDPAASFSGRLGLLSMRERAMKAGGTFAIESRPGQGTHISARIPLPVAGGQNHALDQ